MPHDPSANPPAGKKHALLIGVRTYPQIPKERGGPLAGCHNDVTNMRQALLERDFEHADIDVWVDIVAGCDCPFCQEELEIAGLPTRDGILAAVKSLIARVQHGEIAVLYFSGHGSELAGRGLYAGWRFQTLVPHDSGRGKAPNRDILDLEIEDWTRRLSAATPYSTIIFDCCHSGGATALRGGPTHSAGESDEAAGPTPRRIEADSRDQAAGLRTVLLDEQPDESRPVISSMRGDGASAIVLSASLAHELSSETSLEGRKQGLFTTALTRALREKLGESLRWSELFPQVAADVTAENLAQHPRRQGDGPIFEPGDLELEDIEPADTIELDKLAVVIGLDYQPQEGSHSFPALSTPRQDAEEVARVLRDVQGYEIVGISSKSTGKKAPLLNEKATRRRIHKIIDRLISVKAKTRRETAVVIYFAGHGVVQTIDGKQVGFLVPWDADAEDPSTWLPMKDLRDQLVDGIWEKERLEALGAKRGLQRLTSRHLLLILDCCFGGALAFDFFRGSDSKKRPIYYSEYKRFVEGSAWQLLSSASFNQQALDRNPKDPDQQHSPFAAAVIEGLATERADSSHDTAGADHIVTATELHQFIDAQLKRLGVDVQTPSLMPLRPLEGQFIFHVPGYEPSPLPDPPLDEADNPWPGHAAYEAAEKDASALFVGRELAVLDLLDAFLEIRHSGDRGLAVLGSSGGGKTSLVKAGLLPILRDPAGERRRYRDLLSRWGHDHFLLEAADLETVRAWMAEQELEPLLAAESSAAAEKLAEKVRDWALQVGLLSDGGATTGNATSRLEMASLGMPSFTDHEGYAWCQRIGLLDLIDDPATLRQRLRLWHRRAQLADFFALSNRQAKELVGSWRLVEAVADLPEGSLEDVILHLDGLENRRHELKGPDWQRFHSTADALMLATVRSSALAQDSEWRRQLAADRWREITPARPRRHELRRAIVEPASDRVLIFEPPSIVDQILEETVATPTPLTLLSLRLSDTYARAWARRRQSGSDDRELRAVDLHPKGLGGLLAERAEAVFRRLLRQQPTSPGHRFALRPVLRSVLLRAIELDEGRILCRPIPFAELELFDQPTHRLLHDHLLPEMAQARVFSVTERGVELATPELLTAWPRLRRSIRLLRRYPQARKITPSANAWKSEGYSRGLLIPNVPHLPSMLELSVLSQLERAFVVASELERRWHICMALARKIGNVDSDWASCALRVTAAAQLALQTIQDRQELLGDPAVEEAFAAAASSADRVAHECLTAAEQALHDVLSTTSLSLALEVPPECAGKAILGIAFRDAELRARLGDRVVIWDLEHLEAAPRTSQDVAAAPAQGDGALFTEAERRQRRPRRVGSGPGGPMALASQERAIRFFAPGQAKLPFGPFIKPPTTLLGHQAAADFLLFDRQRRFLASAANGPAGAELRLWPLDREWGSASQPLTRFDATLKEAEGKKSAGFKATSPGASCRLEAGGALPRKLGEDWQITSLAEDLSSFELRHAKDERHLTFKLRESSSEQAPQDPPADRRRGLFSKLPPPPPFLRAKTMAAPSIRLEATADSLTVLSSDGNGCLFSLADGRRLYPSENDPAKDDPARPELVALRLSPDGRRLAVAGLDGSVSLIALDRGALPVFLPGSGRDGFAVRSFAFDRDGGLLAVEREAVYELGRRRLDLYRLDIEELMLLARGHAGRVLTQADFPPVLPIGPSDLGAIADPAAEKIAAEKKLYLAAIRVAGKSE